MPPVPSVLLLPAPGFATAGPVLLLGFGGFLLLLGGCALLVVFLCFDHCLGAPRRAPATGEAPAAERQDPVVLGAMRPATRCHRSQSAGAAVSGPVGRPRGSAPGR